MGYSGSGTAVVVLLPAFEASPTYRFLSCEWWGGVGVLLMLEGPGVAFQIGRTDSSLLEKKSLEEEAW